MAKQLALKVIAALAIGVTVMAVTAYAASFAYKHDAPTISRVLFWPNTVLQSAVPPHNIGTAERPFYEATPFNILAHLASYPFGAVAYAVAAYLMLFRRKGHMTPNNSLEADREA